MEVYLENCFRGTGIWTKVPQSPSLLQKAVEQISEAGGEYQFTRIKINDFDIQPCCGNLFTLNKKLLRFEQLDEEEQQQIRDYEFNEGISFEEALYVYF